MSWALKESASRLARLVFPTPIGPSTTMNRWGFALAMPRSLHQTGDPDAADPGSHVRHPAMSRNHQRGGYIRKRIQDEIAARHSGMRDAQARLVDGLTHHPDEIEIDYARPPPLLPVAPHAALDPEQL